MKIVGIFADNIIWSIKDKGDKDNRFRTLLTQWQDIVYLDQFFDDYRELVEKSRVWKDYTKEQLMLLARSEAQNILKTFNREYTNYKNGNAFEISKMFKVLEGTQLPICLKAYGNYHHPHKNGEPAILRLYAIETSEHQLIITGGGIKLTDQMKDCDYLKEELQRLRAVKEWLEMNDIECLKEVEIEI